MEDGSRLGPPGSGPRRRVLERAVLPSARAVVGGLLVTLSSVITFVAWQHAAGLPERSYAVASRPVAPGERLAAADLRLLPLDLPHGLASAAFSDPAAVVGRVTLAPIGEGELIQAGQLSQGRSGQPTVEVAFALPRDRAVDGQLRSGDLVDVFVTYPDQTTAVATGVRVLSLTDGASGLTAGGEVTVTVALDAGLPRAELIHAVRAGEVTLVRSTEAGTATGGTGPAGPDRDSYQPVGAVAIGGGG